MAIIVAWPGVNVLSSICSASPSITAKRFLLALLRSSKAFTQRGSFSIAITFFAPVFNSARVSPPGPGPISIIAFSFSGPAAFAILFSRFVSNRKCWPSFLSACKLCSLIVSFREESWLK